MADGKKKGSPAQAIAKKLKDAGPGVATAASLLLNGMEVAGKAEDREIGLPHQIVEMAIEIKESRRRLKVLREQRQEHLEGVQEWNDLQESKTALKGQEDKLKIALSSDDDYNQLSENIQEWSHKLTDQEDILSQHLIVYRDEEDEDAVEFGDTERPIVLKARLGKERPIQTELDFDNVEMSEN